MHPSLPGLHAHPRTIPYVVEVGSHHDHLFPQVVVRSQRPGADVASEVLAHFLFRTGVHPLYVEFLVSRLVSQLFQIPLDEYGGVVVPLLAGHSPLELLG